MRTKKQLFITVLALWFSQSALAQDCLLSPFGKTFELGGEHEIYLGGLSRGSIGATRHSLFWRTLDQLQDTPTAPKRLVNYQPGPFQAEVAQTRFTDSHRATAADLNADGYDEFIQAWNTTDNSGQTITQVATTNYRTTPPITNLRWHGAISIPDLHVATGNLDGILLENGGKPNSVILGGLEQGPVPTPVVYVLDTNETDGSIAADPQLANAHWRLPPNERSRVNHMAMAVGDVTGDARDNIVLALTRDGFLEIIVLEWHRERTPDGDSNLREVARRRTTPQLPERIQLAIGPVGERPGNEIVLATGTPASGDPLQNVSLTVEVLRVTPATDGTAAASITSQTEWTLAQASNDSTKGLNLALGDTDGDGLREIVLTYFNSSQSRWQVRTLSATRNIVAQSLFNGPNGNLSNSNIAKLHSQVGDLDGDGFHDIVVAIVDNRNQLRLVHLREVFSPNPQLIENTTFANLEPGQFTESPVIALGDRNFDSLVATFEPVNEGLACRTVTERQLTAVAFVPPYWEHLQGDLDRSAEIARGNSAGSSTSDALTVSHGHSISAYVGNTQDIDILGLFELEATMRVTGGLDLGNSTQTGTERSETQSVSSSNAIEVGEALVRYSETEYQAFNYQMSTDGNLLDGQMRFSEFKSANNAGFSLNDWDQLVATNSVPSWAPVLRDWANLALFREQFASQSSTLLNATADRAIDGKLDPRFEGNSVSATRSELEPWWQVDLGEQTTIRHVRLYNRTDHIRDELKDVWVFVSPTPFGSKTLSELKRDGNVASFFHRGNGLETLHFLTQKNKADVVGRFVRVQREGTGTLSLTEAQVFGPTHVDPHRYPTALRRSFRRPNDLFEVQLYDPKGSFRWVETRGRVQWDGTQDPGLANEIVSVGNGSVGWSLQQDTDTSRFEGSTTSSAVRIGAELDLATGAFGIDVEFGGGYEFSTGIDEESTTTTTYGKSLEIAGSVSNFASLDKEICKYNYIPYLYEVSSQSNLGYEHRFFVVDYLVPNRVLDRERWEAYCECQDKSDRPEPSLPARFLAEAFDFDDPRMAYQAGSFRNESENRPEFRIGDGPSGLRGDRYVSFDGNRTLRFDNAPAIVRAGFDGFSIEAWVRHPTNTASRFGTIVSGSNSADRWYRFYLTEDGRLGMFYSVEGRFLSDQSIPNDGQWHHIAQVSPVRGDIRFYIDGQPAGTKPMSLSTAELGLTLGQSATANVGVEVTRFRPGGGAPAEFREGFKFNGDLDRLRFSPAVLAPWELDSDPDARGTTRIVFPNAGGQGLEGFYPAPRGFGSFPASHPNLRTETLPHLTNTPGNGRGYGLVLTGFIVPTETGFHTFRLNSPNPAEFHLSLDPSPTGTRMVAATPTQPLSDPIWMEAGQRYFYEAVMREQSNNETLTIAWQRPGDPLPNNQSAPIHNTFLRPLGGIDHELTTRPAPSDADKNWDGDQLTNLQEFERGTDPRNADTDGDGLLDHQETNTGIWIAASVTGTDPLDPDSDDDGLLDGYETNTRFFIDPQHTGTDPHEWDTDGDDASDGEEVAQHYNPLDPENAPTTGGRRNGFFGISGGSGNLPPPPTDPTDPEPTDPNPSPSDPALNYALEFDGNDDYVRIPQSIIPTEGNFTIEFWYRMDESALGIFREALSQANEARFPRFYVGMTPEGNIRAGDAWSDTGVRLPTDGQWHHVALVRSSQNTHVFLDASGGATLGRAIPNPSRELWTDIGQQFGGGEFWQGGIDELRIWATDRSLADIAEHRTRRLNGDEEGLVAYYPFDEGPDAAETRNTVPGASSASHGALRENPTWVMGLALAEPPTPEPPVVEPPVNPTPDPGIGLPPTMADCPKPGRGGLLNFLNTQGAVMNPDGSLAGNNVIGQIWAGPTRTQLQPVCEPITVFALGTFAGGVVELPFVGTTAFVQLRAWSGAVERADAPLRGESGIVELTLNAPDVLLPPPSLPTSPFRLRETPAIDLPPLGNRTLAVSITDTGLIQLEWEDSIRLQLQAASRFDGPWFPVLAPRRTPGERSPLIIDSRVGPTIVAPPGQTPFIEGYGFFRLIDLLAE